LSLASSFPLPPPPLRPTTTAAAAAASFADRASRISLQQAARAQSISEALRSASSSGSGSGRNERAEESSHVETRQMKCSDHGARTCSAAASRIGRGDSVARPASRLGSWATMLTESELTFTRAHTLSCLTRGSTTSLLRAHTHLSPACSVPLPRRFPSLL